MHSLGVVEFREVQQIFWNLLYFFCFSFFLLLFISLNRADGPHHYHPACGH